ncbi:hypothetical protein RB628_39220 [Streptomyces sp. ADMS]|uniref:hypothetical protein n=1 Tax=Streptomyces sp. ADMS TaxID=3071415 RepID=UPI00296E2F61|nr:hypothetical protein [Streptomyces sp. ADMS]MDW4911178.1 hypothetical protein [Streptomyces sp. ADMS]
MPPTPATVPVHAPGARSLRQGRLVLTALYALLFAMLTCLSDQLHTSEQPYGHLAAASSEVPSPADDSEGESLDASDSPDRCHDAPSEAAAFSKSSARASSPATAPASLAGVADRLSHDPRVAARRLPPSGGRPALIALCQWRI